MRDSNSVGRGLYTPGRQFGGGSRPLEPRMVKPPWIPAESEWARLLQVFSREPIRNRLVRHSARPISSVRKQAWDEVCDDGRRALFPG